jgi:hypothetical protein
MPHKSSMGINAAWHSLISMVIIVMHRTHYRLWLTLWTAEEANGGAWNIAVACSCMAGRQGLAKPIYEPPYSSYCCCFSEPPSLAFNAPSSTRLPPGRPSPPSGGLSSSKLRVACRPPSRPHFPAFLAGSGRSFHFQRSWRQGIAGVGSSDTVAGNKTFPENSGKSAVVRLLGQTCKSSRRSMCR